MSLFTKPGDRRVRFALWWLLLSALGIFSMAQPAQLAQTDPARIEEETMLHFQAILRLDTSNPPGNEKLVVDYLKGVLDREGIETKIFALDPQRPLQRNKAVSSTEQR